MLFGPLPKKKFAISRKPQKKNEKGAAVMFSENFGDIHDKSCQRKPGISLALPNYHRQL